MRADEKVQNQNILLDVSHLQKGYGRFPVLEDVSFQIKKGHILGLIGKNGAGKTTLMKVLLGLNKGYTGKIEFDGSRMNPGDEQVNAKIGSLVDVTFYEDMTAWQNLNLAMLLTDGIAGAQRKRRMKELLEFVGLTNAGNRSVRTFSFGMKQRLALAQALITSPALLILDEPFVGLDPIGIEETKELLRKLCREAGTSIIFSSHQLNEVCDLADDIVVLNQGKIVYSDTYDAVRASGASMMELMR